MWLQSGWEPETGGGCERVLGALRPVPACGVPCQHLCVPGQLPPLPSAESPEPDGSVKKAINQRAFEAE